CEEVTRAEVEEGVAAGGTNLRTLKVMTRVGMGPCQGRMCWPALARFLAAATGGTPEAAGPLSVRPPIVPVPLEAIARDEAALRRQGGGPGARRRRWWWSAAASPAGPSPTS